MRILLVDDDRKLRDVVARGLKAEGYAVDGAGRISDATDLVSAQHYDLIVLDLQLPDATGTDLLRYLRRNGLGTPVLVLTGRKEIDVKGANFDAGADDYLTKPFAFAELAMRVKALLRRPPVMSENLIKIADLELDRMRHSVHRGGRRIDLSPKEFSLLEYLALNPRRVMSRSMIIDQVWDSSFEGLTNIVDVYVRQVRKKVDEPFETKLIRTVRGVGYAIDPAGER